MAASDATPFPVKNQAYRVTFPIFDADGDLVTGATALDSEVSKDGGTFADATSEATEIATASGMYFLDLTATEMNADTVAVIVKTATAGAKTTPMVLYPVEDSDIRVNVRQWLGVAPSALISGRVDANAQVVGTGAIVAGSFAAGAIDAGSIATDAIGSAELSQAAADKVWSTTTRALTDKAGFSLSSAGVQAIWDALTSALTTVGSIGKRLADFITGDAFVRLGAPAGASVSADIAAVQADTDNIQTRIPAALVSGRMDASVGAMAADTVTAAALAADAGNEIADALLNRDMATGTDTVARSVRNALRFLRNKWSISGTTLTVTKEDDTTAAWTSALTENAAANPVVGSDPA